MKNKKNLKRTERWCFKLETQVNHPNLIFLNKNVMNSSNNGDPHMF